MKHDTCIQLINFYYMLTLTDSKSIKFDSSEAFTIPTGVKVGTTNIKK